MKENFPVHHPRPGIYLTCVNPEDCRDSSYVKGSHNPRPVIYGVSTFPQGFVEHDPRTCPVPRTSTFQTLEEFYSQDFLQTFTDCLKLSDFSTRGAKAMGFSSTKFFEGSSVSGGGERVLANLLGATLEYPYECCMHPSFYIANVRGLQRNTPYYNPLFTTVHDFNCFAEDGCFSFGSLKNVQEEGGLGNTPYDFPKASPRSVMWYMQNAIASVQLDDTNVDKDFWEDGVVGNIEAIGGTLEHGGLPDVLAVNAPSTKNLGGNAALFQAIRHSYGATDTPSQAAQKSFGFFSCPSTINATGQTSEPPWNTNLMYPVPDSWALSATPGELDCCTRGTDYTLAPPGSFVEGGQGEIPQNLSSFLENCETQTLEEDYIPQTVSPLTCSNYHCLESSYCQSLLKRACKDFSTEHAPPDFNYGGYCTRWRNWASNNYAAIQPGQRTASAYPNNTGVKNPPPTFNNTAVSYPSGAYMSSVDQSVFSLIDACSSTDFSQPQPLEILDQCRGLLSVTSQQTTFPRLRPLTFDTPIQYSHEVVTPYTVDSSNNQIDILLTYTAYVYKNDSTLINNLINTGNTAGFSLLQQQTLLNSFIVVPQIENVVSLTTIFLDNIVALDSLTFYNSVRENFNLKLSTISQFIYDTTPAPPIGSITVPIGEAESYNCLHQSDNNDYNTYFCKFIFSSFSLPFIDHSFDKISWDSNGSISVVHNFINNSDYYSTIPPPFEDQDGNLIGPGFTDSITFINYNNRLENISFLYDPINVFWNSIMDNYNLSDYNPNRLNIWVYNNNSGCANNNNNQFCYLLNSFQNFVFTKNTTDANSIVSLNDPIQKQRLDEKITVVFNPNLSQFLGLDRQGNSVSVILNPYNSISCNKTFTANKSLPISPFPGTPFTFSSPLSTQSPTNDITPFNLINSSQFWLTNTTPIPIYSLSVLNYSSNRFIVTFNPPSNPSSPLMPGESVSVNVLDPSFPDNSGSYSGVPILFYDAGVGGWQNNFQSPDFPVLGGFLSARGIDISTQNSYGNGERFSSYSSDNNLDFGEDFQGTISTILTYYANQNLYSTGEANSGGVAAISQMFLAPLI